jgi:cell division transport system ATP-binding protein
VRIEARNLGYTYPAGPTVFAGFDWEIESGSLWFLVGPSGTGKTTWFRLCLGLVRPTQGSLRVDGLDLGCAPPAALQRLRLQTGVVFQDFRLMAQQTVFDNVAVALRMAGVAGPDVAVRTHAALAAVGLPDLAHRRVATLSWGQQQRVAFARAWVRRPRLFLADEPTGNLDGETARSIMDLVARIHDEGATVVVATHDLTLVDRLGGRVLRLTPPPREAADVGLPEPFVARHGPASEGK